MITDSDEIDVFGDKSMASKLISTKNKIRTEKLSNKQFELTENENIKKEDLIQLLKHKTPDKKTEKYTLEDIGRDYYSDNKSEIIIPELNMTDNVNMDHVNIDKWWNSYLTIPNRIEFGGHGYDYSDINDTSPSGLVYYVNEFISNIPLSQYPKVLDIGAGNGGETKLLLDKGYNVTGITMGIDNVKIAKELYNVDIINTDMNHLNFEINSFDAVMMIQTFEHFLSPFIATIELWRVLRVNGLCYLDVPCPLDKPMWSINHTNLLYADQIINMFSMCGFELVKQLSKKNEHRIRLIFKKLSISKIRNWEQLRHIHQLRNEV